MTYIQPVILRPVGSIPEQGLVAAFQAGMEDIQEYYRRELGGVTFVYKDILIVDSPTLPPSVLMGWDEVVNELLALGAIVPSTEIGYTILVQDTPWDVFEGGFEASKGVIAAVGPGCVLLGLANRVAPEYGCERPWYLSPPDYEWARGAIAHEFTHMFGGLGHHDEPGIDNLTYDWWAYPNTVLLDWQKEIIRQDLFIAEADRPFNFLLPVLALGGLVAAGIITTGMRQKR